jgi:hypothetical protein
MNEMAFWIDFALLRNPSNFIDCCNKCDTRPRYAPLFFFWADTTCMLLWMSVRLGWGNSAAIAALVMTPFLAATGSIVGAEARKRTDVQASIAIPAKTDAHVDLTALPN